MPLPRFRIGTLMIAVAVVVIGLGIKMWLDRRVAAFRAMARYHYVKAIHFSYKPTPDNERRKDYHEKLALKYGQASRCPWLPVPPDPPEPK